MKWRSIRRGRFAVLLAVLGSATTVGTDVFGAFPPGNGAGEADFHPPRFIDPTVIGVPPGYCIEPVVTGLTYPTAVVTDEMDRVYVLEAGYSYGEDFRQPRLLRVEPGGPSR